MLAFSLVVYRCRYEKKLFLHVFSCFPIIFIYILTTYSAICSDSVSISLFILYYPVCISKCIAIIDYCHSAKTLRLRTQYTYISRLEHSSRQITLGKGSKKTTYTVNYTIFAQSYGGISAQVSWANVKWRDARNKLCSVDIIANSTNESMKKALSSYCAVLAQLNKGLWKDFMVKYVTDGWKLAGLNTVKNFDDKTVSKFFDHSEKLALAICGDKEAKKALVNDAEGTLKEKLSKMTKTKFQNFIKQNVPNGDKLVKAADQYKKVNDKYNDYKNKFENGKKRKKTAT